MTTVKESFEEFHQELLVQLLNYFDDAALAASDSAEATVKSWTEPRDKESGQGGLAFQTFRATCTRKYESSDALCFRSQLTMTLTGAFSREQAALNTSMMVSHRFFSSYQSIQQSI